MEQDLQRMLDLVERSPDKLKSTEFIIGSFNQIFAKYYNSNLIAPETTIDATFCLLIIYQLLERNSYAAQQARLPTSKLDLESSERLLQNILLLINFNISKDASTPLGKPLYAVNTETYTIVTGLSVFFAKTFMKKHGPNLDASVLLNHKHDEFFNNILRLSKFGNSVIGRNVVHSFLHLNLFCSFVFNLESHQDKIQNPTELGEYLGNLLAKIKSFFMVEPNESLADAEICTLQRNFGSDVYNGFLL